MQRVLVSVYFAANCLDTLSTSLQLLHCSMLIPYLCRLAIYPVSNFSQTRLSTISKVYVRKLPTTRDDRVMAGILTGYLSHSLVYFIVHLMCRVTSLSQSRLNIAARTPVLVVLGSRTI